MKSTFKKYNRLNSVKTIGELFKKGNGFGFYPLKFLILKTELIPIASVQLLISVPKRHFKKAVHRNRIKRLIRESYRKNINKLWPGPESLQGQFAIAIIYTGHHMPEYPEVESKVIAGINKLVNNIMQ
jgi:ribonuclease P protein component